MVRNALLTAWIFAYGKSVPRCLNADDITGVVNSTVFFDAGVLADARLRVRNPSELFYQFEQVGNIRGLYFLR